MREPTDRPDGNRGEQLDAALDDGRRRGQVALVQPEHRELVEGFVEEDGRRARSASSRARSVAALERAVALGDRASATAMAARAHSSACQPASFLEEVVHVPRIHHTPHDALGAELQPRRVGEVDRGLVVLAVLRASRDASTSSSIVLSADIARTEAAPAARCSQRRRRGTAWWVSPQPPRTTVACPGRPRWKATSARRLAKDACGRHPRPVRGEERGGPARPSPRRAARPPPCTTRRLPVTGRAGWRSRLRHQSA